MPHFKEKIAYIGTIDAYQHSGVLNKLTSQVNIWNNLGVEARLFILSKPPGNIKNPASIINSKYSAILYNRVANFLTRLTGKKQIYLNKVLSSPSLKSEIKSFKPDVIFYRFGIWFPGQISLFSEFPVIIELNSNDLDEFMFYGKLTRLIHFSTRDFLLKRANGFCSVSSEIDKIIAAQGTPSLVIGNGVDTTKITQRPLPNNHRAQVIFVGSPDCIWHGIDKILILAGTLRQYDFHIAGPNIKENHDLPNVTFHGFLEKDPLAKLYKKIDMAIGTLSLHKNNMAEASPLKVREYVAYGLPVIVGYNDTDLSDQPYILNIGNYEYNVRDNTKRISEFIEFWKGKVINANLDCIDMTHKEKQRLTFIRSFIS